MFIKRRKKRNNCTSVNNNNNNNNNNSISEVENFISDQGYQGQTFKKKQFYTKEGLET